MNQKPMTAKIDVNTANTECARNECSGYLMLMLLLWCDELGLLTKSVLAYCS